jgi:hypothetical protein
MSVQVQAPIALTTGAYTTISAAAFARYVEIAEDGSVAPAGIVVKWPNGNVDTYTPAQQPVRIGNPGGGGGALVGCPSYQTGVTATQYCQVKSVAATGSLRVSEWN